MINAFKTTEKSVRLIEAENTIVIKVDIKSKKTAIKKEVETRFGVKVDRINTLIKDNKKFAYVKLNEKNPAIDVATKFGLI
ncbi:50S ribosomal protein L23 [Candidatus Pacearchaeota archaeon]|nr:50S ribosomal protein L23 [Candidatus Pacearchaeota archaeon]